MTESAPTIDPTPRWREILSDKPELHTLLQRVAEAVYEQTEEPVDVGGTEADLRAAKASGESDKSALARQVGALVAARAKEKGVGAVVFDRGGSAYHGRIAALADGARENGLEF